MKKKTIGRYLKYRWIKYKYDRKERIFLRRKKRNRARAIKEANLRHEGNGKRYWILEGLKPGTFWVGNNEDVKIAKKRGMLSKEVSIHHLLTESVYHTA
ncbi:hypothetical protein DRQ25_15260, partial [Candidatus Fermentibacteria bacterium]